MMLPMQPSHKESTCVFNAWRLSRRKRGNGTLSCSGLLNGVFGTGAILSEEDPDAKCPPEDGAA